MMRNLLIASALAVVSTTAAAAGVITMEPFSWQPSGTMDWIDGDDDNISEVDLLGFTVTLGGQSFDSFTMSSNGFVELVNDGDTPYGGSYGTVSNLINTHPQGTYLMAAYDDLDSSSYGYYGYALQGDRAVFNWVTETYEDEGSGLLNIFQLVLHSDGSVDWNFLDGGYASYGYNLFSGIYLGGTGELIEATKGDIPSLTSYHYSPVPVPAAAWLFGTGLLGMAAIGRRGRAAGH